MQVVVTYIFYNYKYQWYFIIQTLLFKLMLGGSEELDL
jgi:hypothetical protein